MDLSITFFSSFKSFHKDTSNMTSRYNTSHINGLNWIVFGRAVHSPAVVSYFFRLKNEKNKKCFTFSNCFGVKPLATTALLSAAAVKATHTHTHALSCTRTFAEHHSSSLSHSRTRTRACVCACARACSPCTCLTLSPCRERQLPTPWQSRSGPRSMDKHNKTENVI